MMLDYFYGQSGELFSYFRIPKALFQDHRFRQLSTDARTLYGILLDCMSLSVKLFRELEQLDLIERKRRGLGRPSLIYVKDFSSGLPKAQVQNCLNSNSGAAESATLEQPKPQANKTDKNKTEWNDPDTIYSGGIREQLEDYFYQALEVDLLLRLCPDDEDTIYQIVDLLVDTCSAKRKMLRIAGDDKPTEVVRSRLKKLNADHIRFVLGCLAENTAPVRNMKQYLLAMLYNAPTTMNLYRSTTNQCASHFVRASVLETVILKAIQAVSRYALENEAEFVADLQSVWDENKAKSEDTGQYELEEARKRVAELDTMIQNLYESSMKGVLPERQARRMIQQYDEEQILLERRMEELENQIRQESVKKADTERFLALVKKYRDCHELTDATLYSFIDRVEVHEATGGRTIYRKQNIDIYFNFIGSYYPPCEAVSEEARIAAIDT